MRTPHDAGSSRRAVRRRTTPVQRAHSQERQYVSQGVAVKRAATHQRLQRTPSTSLGSQPYARPGSSARARAQQGGYVSQGRAVKKAATQQRSAAALRSQRSRQRYFSHDPVGSLRRKERRGVLALAMLQAQDPKKYATNLRRARDTSPLKLRTKTGDLLAEAGREGNTALRKTGEFLKERNIASRRATDPLYHAGVGPDASKAGREVIDLVANTPSGVYMAGAAGLEAAQGRPERAHKLWKDFKHTSALAPAASAVSKAVQGKPAGKDLKEAARRAKERPITTALELSGAKALVGRGAGAALRAAPSKTLKQIGGTERPNLKLYDPDREGPGPEIQRAYSRDVINKGLQKYAEHRIREGSRIRKNGTQRRPGRDPHVDRGARLVPPNPMGHGSAPRRVRLERRVDTRYHAQQRALEARAHQAAKDARRALKGKDPERLQTLRLQAQADKVRLELRTRLQDASSAARKDLRRLIALPDEKLLQEVSKRGQDRMGPRTTALSRYSPEDQAIIVKFPEGTRVRAELRPKPAVSPRVPHLEAQDFGDYFANRSRRIGVAPKPVKATADDQALAALRPTDADLGATAVSRAYRNTMGENQRLFGEEFGIGPIHGSRAKAARWARRARPDADLVPLKLAEGEWRAAPRVVADRLASHRNVDESIFGPGSRLDRASSVFKDVVLTTSSPARWLGGNVGDLGTRMLLEGITPHDIARGFKVDQQLSRMGLQGEQARAATTGGGMYTTGRDITPASTVGKLNIPRHVWHAWKKGVYGLEHSIELLPQWGRVGKAMRRESARHYRVQGEEPSGLWRDSPINEFRNPYNAETGMHVPHHQAQTWKAEDGYMKVNLRSLLKLHDQQITHFAQRLATDRAMEARIQKATEDVIGRWGKVSPTMRRALSLAPFAQWLGAATRYVYVTLPVHHPIKTSILAGISQMTEDERIRLGLSYFAPTEDRAPDYQMGTLPMSVGQNKYGPVVAGIRTSRMTSLGTAATTPWNLPEFLMPQVASGLNALRGQSFTGEPLVYPNSAGPDRAGLPMDFIDRLPVAAGAQLESMLPFASAFRRSILEQGRPSEPFSTILTPATRPKFNYDTKQYEQRPADPGGGIKEWLTPWAPPSRIYTLGAQRDIERSQNTLRQLQQWNQHKKRKADAAHEYGPKNDDFWSEPSGPKPKPVRPQQTDEFWK